MAITLEHLYAARRLLLQRRPFLAPFLFLCQIHLVDGRDAFCDRHWQIYIGKDWPAGTTPAKRLGRLAVVLYHELLHLVQEHFQRGEHLARIDSESWLLSCELEINDDLLNEVRWDQEHPPGSDDPPGVLRMPKGALLPQALRLPVGLAAEEYWRLLQERKDPTAPADPTNPTGPSRKQTRNRRRRSQPGSNPNRRPRCCGGGSGTGGPAHPLELSLDDSASAPNDGEKAVAVREFAHQATEFFQDGTPGSRPGWLQRLPVDEWTAQPIPWYHLLERYLHEQFRGRGVDDYSWRQPNRRNPFPNEIILPGLSSRPPGDVGFLIDTSGSMRTADLAQAFGIVKEILQRVCAVNGPAVHLIGCDATAKYAGRIQSPHQLASLELPRGGGTDLRVGIELADKQNLSLKCLLVLTDGRTPWPASPPRFDLIVALLGSYTQKIPAWATSVIVPT
jgi:hypothetical protein